LATFEAQAKNYDSLPKLKKRESTPEEGITIIQEEIVENILADEAP
jgi:hypothetical protein